jgi:hypothetical protein
MKNSDAPTIAQRQLRTRHPHTPMLDGYMSSLARRFGEVTTPQ